MRKEKVLGPNQEGRGKNAGTGLHSGGIVDFSPDKGPYRRPDNQTKMAFLRSVVAASPRVSIEYVRKKWAVIGLYLPVPAIVFASSPRLIFCHKLA